MATVNRPAQPETDPRVKAVFDDIRATRGSDFINNFWAYLAFDPALLETTWQEVKAVMASNNPALDAKTKEMLYVAVSVANSCGYCIHSHTAARPSCAPGPAVPPSPVHRASPPARSVQNARARTARA